MVYPYYPNYQQFFPQNYQPIQPPPQPPQPQQPTPSGIIWISGLMEAQSYPVAPNNAVVLWENSGKVIYLKQADATGKPTIRIYDLVERTETASNASASPDDKTNDYVTKDELKTLVGAVKGLAGEIETMKGDLYGVAGRKKAVKKEATDDDA